MLCKKVLWRSVAIVSTDSATQPLLESRSAHQIWALSMAIRKQRQGKVGACCQFVFPILNHQIQDANPWAAKLLLGVEALDASKDVKATEHQRSASFAAGFEHIERAFNANQKMRPPPIASLSFSSKGRREKGIEALRTSDPVRGYAGRGTEGSFASCESGSYGEALRSRLHSV